MTFRKGFEQGAQADEVGFGIGGRRGIGSGGEAEFAQGGIGLGQARQFGRITYRVVAVGKDGTEGQGIHREEFGIDGLVLHLAIERAENVACRVGFFFDELSVVFQGVVGAKAHLARLGLLLFAKSEVEFVAGHDGFVARSARHVAEFSAAFGAGQVAIVEIGIDLDERGIVGSCPSVVARLGAELRAVVAGERIVGFHV